MLGFGRIGQQVARRALGLGMRVIAYDPFVSRERFRELGVERVETPGEVLAAADFLTLHLPLNDETRGRIDAAAIAQMRDGVRIVNAARGELVDEEALYDALVSGKVAGAALDVFSTEPYTGPLLELENVVATPHLAASTDEAQDRAGVIVAEQVVAALEGGLVTNAVNIPVDRRGGPRGARAVHPARREARPPGDGARGGPRGAARARRTSAPSPSTTRGCSRSRR